RADRDRRPGGGNRPGRPRGLGALRARAEVLRRADRPAPDDPVDAGRHGHQRGRGAAPPLAGRHPQGSGSAVRHGRLDGQALRVRDGDEGDHRRHPGARRLRLHQGLPGGAVLPRRQDHADLRGHIPDPAPRDRAGDPGGGMTRDERARDERARPGGERKPAFETMGGLPVERVYTPADLPGWTYDEKLGNPGEFPFTRGVYPTMYRGRLWTMRMFAGFGTPEDTNRRFRFLLREGQTGLSTAFDMPALMGYDAD